MAHWIVDAITLAYQAQGVPCPLRLRAHSTRGVASSWALARGASLTDICRAAGWATPNTFARFYSLRVEPVSSRVLTSGQRHGEVPAQYRLAALHTLIAPESPYRQTLLSPPITLRQPDVAERPAPGLYSVVSLRTGFRLGPICVTLQGSICVIPWVAPKQTRVFPSGRTHLSSGWSHPSASICSAALQG